jgi:hypothetical protein
MAALACPACCCARAVWEVTVLQDDGCIELMQRFIREQPVLWNEDIGV